ncbi:MAG: hypothetical protein ABI054_07525 [Planctomycetota bacterium]
MTHRLLLIAATLASLAAGCAVTGVQGGLPRKAPRQLGVMFDGRMTLAAGDYDHDTDGSFDDETKAGFVGLRAEASNRSGLGGGVSIEVMNSDDDLFEGQTANESQATSVEIAPFFLYRVDGGDRFRMPLRAGPWIHALTLDEQHSSDSLTWVSVGLRVAVEPEIVLARSEGFEFSLFSEVSLAGGGTQVHQELGSGDEDYDTGGGAFGFEIGPRFRWSHFSAGVSLLHRSLSFDKSDRENNVRIPGIDTSFDAFAISFGGGF